MSSRFGRFLTGLLAGVSLSLAVPAAGHDYRLRPQQIAPEVYAVIGATEDFDTKNGGNIVNTAFIVGSDGVVVIDSGPSLRYGQQLRQAIARVTDKPVSHVIVTHYHADHVYGLQVFADRGIPILAHQAGREYLHADTARLRLQASREELAPWINDKTRLVPATQWVDGRQELTVGDTQLVLQPVGPAHTPEDIVVYLPDEGMLFAGDLVFRGRVPYVGQADSRQWIAALDSLLALQPKVIAPGHGALSNTARDDLQLTRDYLVYLRETMGAAAREMERVASSSP